ncbi:MAG: hypothetical protein GX310_07195 [Synergistaceae bacterium]|nr:hypothetical protein [Synergistaceae bacterium]
MLLLCRCARGAPDHEDAGWAPIISVRAGPDGTLFVAAAEKGGVYSSTNGGKSWRHIGGTLAPDNLFSLRVSAGGDVFLATFGEALYSGDGGVSWSFLKEDGFIKDLFPARSGAILAANWRGGLSSASAETGIWKSVGDDAFLITDFMESEDKRLWCAAFGGGVLVSYDGGISWGSCGGGPENGMVLSLAWSHGDKILYAGTYEGGVFMRREDGPWQRGPGGLPRGSTVQALTVSKDGSLWAGTHGNGCFVLKRGSKNWENLTEGGGKGVSVTAIEPFRDGVVFGTASGGLYYAEAGRSFVRPLLPSDPVAGLAELESGAVTALSRSGRLYRSDDRGVTWKEIELP